MLITPSLATFNLYAIEPEKGDKQKMVVRLTRLNSQQCCQSCQSEYADSCIRLWEVLLAFLSGILTVVTFGTPFWSEQSSVDAEHGTKDTYHEGLWQSCHTPEGCKAIPYDDSE